MRRKKLRLFILVALVEHVILTLLLAAMIYTRPAVSEDPDEGTVEVILDIPIEEPRPPEEPAEELPPPINLPETPAKLPGLQSSYAPQTMGYPNLDQAVPGIPRIAAADLNPESFSTVRPPRPRMLEQGESRDDAGFVPMRLTPNREGAIAAPSARPIPEQGTRRIAQGRSGPPSMRNIADASITGSSKNLRAGRPGGVRLAGEVAGRRVEYWPEIPEYKGRDVGEVVLKFWVDPQGHVLRVSPQRRPSDPELERLAIRFVESIRFAPLDPRAEQRDQWGVITIDFTQRTVTPQ